MPATPQELMAALVTIEKLFDGPLSWRSTQTDESTELVAEESGWILTIVLDHGTASFDGAATNPSEKLFVRLSTPTLRSYMANVLADVVTGHRA